MISSTVVDAVKMASGILVSSGVSTMVGYAAKSSVPKIAPHIIRRSPKLIEGWKVFQKIAIPAGAAALAGLASEQAVKYADKKIDETVRDIENIKQTVDAATNLKKKNKPASDETTSETVDEEK